MVERQSAGMLANTVRITTQVSKATIPAVKPGVVRQPGEHLDRYIILDKLGEGGMGIVYAAYDPKLDRKVALKVLSAGLVGTFRDEARGRMVAEARAIARVNHVNVVAVHDVGTAGEEVFVGMELVEGCNLTEWRKQGSRDWREVVEVFCKVGEGLAAVHAAGLIHRDVKPANILLDRAGHVRVTDFGLARASLGAPTVLDGSERAVVDDSVMARRFDLTVTGAYLGTPAYMSPEQFGGGVVSEKSDQFGFAVSLWESLYGVLPFAGESFATLREAVLSGSQRPPPSGSGVPRWLHQIVARGLHQQPSERWPSIGAMVAALAAGDPRKRARRWGFIAAAVTVAAGFAGGLYLQDISTTKAQVQACQDSSEALLWDPPRRQALTDVLAQAEAAPETASRVMAELDTYADRWREAKAQACLAVEVEQTVDRETGQRRQECLDARRVHFEATVEQILESGTRASSQSLRAVQGLSDIERCSDRHHLAALPRQPEDAGTRAKAVALSQTLIGTLAGEYFGNYEEGLATASQVLAQAQALGHRPLIADAMYRVAAFEEKLGRYEQAVAHFVAAYHEAAVVGNDELAGDCARVLAHTEGYQLARYNVGLRWAELAEIHHRRSKKMHSMQEAQRLDVLAVMLEMKGELEDSIATHERSIALRRAIDENDKSVAYGLHNYASVLEAAGQKDRAREARIEAVQRFEAHYGPDNPTTAHARFALANLLRDLENFSAAQVAYDRVREVWQRALGPTHPDFAALEDATGRLLWMQGRLDEAIVHHQKAREIYQTSLPPGHPDFAQNALHLAQAQVHAGQVANAIKNFQVSIEILEAAEGDQFDRLARARVQLGEALLGTHDPAAAEVFSQAVADCARSTRPIEQWRHRAALALAWTQARDATDPAKAAAAQDKLEAMTRDGSLGEFVRARCELALSDVVSDPERKAQLLGSARARLVDSTLPNELHLRHQIDFRVTELGPVILAGAHK